MPYACIIFGKTKKKLNLNIIQGFLVIYLDCRTNSHTILSVKLKKKLQQQEQPEYSVTFAIYSDSTNKIIQCD